MKRKILVEYDRKRDKYLPACELSRIFCIIKNTKRLTDQDLSLIQFLDFDVKITDFDLPQSYFDDSANEYDYPTMAIFKQKQGFSGHHKDFSGMFVGEPLDLPVYDINAVFLALLKDPQKKHYNNLNKPAKTDPTKLYSCKTCGGTQPLPKTFVDHKPDCPYALKKQPVEP